ncbi:ABC transporter permease [Paenibacillus daejeonensis]|uniref:ABC transporter permease n=1 Tax=Paenibacillus daejeonensis TaxID=135193 RepID=UPI0003672033|nr:ABC transporter permease [Paenibacillus daejeonensis]
MFFKKDLLLFLKDWKGIAVVLISPMVLILILGFSIRGVTAENPDALRVEAALVMEGDTAGEITAFKDTLPSRGLDDEAQAELAASAETLAPSRLLLNMLDYEDVQSWVQMHHMDAAQAMEALEALEIDAILTVPAGFDTKGLSRMLLSEGDPVTLQVTAGGSSTLQVQLFEGIIESFTRSLSFQTAVHQQLSERGASEEAIAASSWQAVELPEGGLDPDTGMAPVTSFQYYTFSMTVLFVLFIASNSAGKAYQEKRQYVYNRIILADRSPLRYLTAKTTSTALIAWLQLMLVFVVSQLILDVFPGASMQLWLGLGLISAGLAWFVGGLCALFTALNFRFDGPAAGLLFAGVGVTIMAVLGGSMGPLATMPDWINRLGIWTPNGLSLSTYVQWIQEQAPGALLQPIGYLVMGGMILVAAGCWTFPGRRRVS